MKIKHFIVCLFGIITFISCVLSTEQETKLNANMNQLIIVRNDGDALSFMNYTHPIVVKYYKQKGDSIFKNKFQEIPRKINQDKIKTKLIYWENGYIKSTKSSDSLVQAKIQITLVQNHKSLDSSTFYYGLTTKSSSSWTFVSKEDYFSILPQEMRLFKD